MSTRLAPSITANRGLQTDLREYPPSLAADGLPVGIVMSRLNPQIGEGLLSACTGELHRLGVDRARSVLSSVPGALEIPLA